MKSSFTFAQVSASTTVGTVINQVSRLDDSEWLVAGRERCHPDAIAIPASSSSELQIFRDVADSRRWSELNSILTVPTYFLAVPPSDHLAIAIRAGFLKSKSASVPREVRWDDFLIQLAETESFETHDEDSAGTAGKIDLPDLEQPAQPTGSNYVHQLIRQLKPTSATGTSVELAAFKAGLYLLNEMSDESHSASQSIEGRGKYHSGDYWHAIVHRREPDFGNSKYWFRHVGKHPIFVDLARRTQDSVVAEPRNEIRSRMERWISRLAPSADWDPFAFVDFCSSISSEPQLRPWCEWIQYEEMMLLMTFSAAELYGRPIN